MANAVYSLLSLNKINIATNTKFLQKEIVCCNLYSNVKKEAWLKVVRIIFHHKYAKYSYTQLVLHRAIPLTSQHLWKLNYYITAHFLIGFFCFSSGFMHWCTFVLIISAASESFRFGSTSGSKVIFRCISSIFKCRSFICIYLFCKSCQL